MKQIFSTRALMSGVVVALLFVAVPSANHSWGGYHWASSGGTLTLTVGDNVNSTWDPFLDEALVDWERSVLNFYEVPGGTTGRKCRPTAGRIEVCNASYGNNGWLGLAQIWLSGGHISQALTKVNDTYFNTATYDTPAWRRLVMCQEIGHDFGLDHQDETNNNYNLGSCMDYTNDPDGGPGGFSETDPSNEHPNRHDYDQIASIYNHTDSGAAATAVDSDPADHPSQWGRLVRQNGDRRVQVFELDLGQGRKMLTHVFWADPEADERGRSGR